MTYEYIIQARYPKPNCLPFPATYGGWKIGRQLKESMDGILPANQSVPVAVKVLNSARMAMIPDSGSDWTHMAKRDGFWRCNVTTGNGGNELVMGAIWKLGKVYTCTS